MERVIIKINDCGLVTIPCEVRMTILEIAELFGIYYPTAKRHIRSIEKLGVADGNYPMSCVVEGQKVVPEYYGLEMIIAVAFRIQSPNAEMFREWVIRKLTQHDTITTLMLSLQNSIFN